jgi:phosphatidylserine/phosphatidylglycerophosphate/cardiolipin synthase-like enzyme
VEIVSSLRRLTGQLIFLLLLFTNSGFVIISIGMTNNHETSLDVNSFDSRNSFFDSQSVIHHNSQNFTGSMDVTVYTNPDCAQSQTISYIDSASTELCIEIYSISSKYIMDALHRAVSRGVELYLIASWKQASGAEYSYTRAALYNLSQISDPDVYLFLSSSSDFEFQHAKFMVIDQQIVVIQSGNFAKSSLSPDPTGGNREWFAAVNDAAVAGWYYNVFQDDMVNAEFYTPDSGDEETFSYDSSGSSYSHPFSATTFNEAMTIQTVLSPDNDVSVISHLIQSAKYSIDIQQMYIKADWDGSSNTFVDELINAVNRGVEVRVNIDPDGSGVEEIVPILLAGGIEVSYSPDVGGYFNWNHNKGIIIDAGHSKAAILVSSINWSFESTHENREAGIIFYNQHITDWFENVFQNDWDNSELLDNSQTDTFTTSAISFGLAVMVVTTLTFLMLVGKKQK